MARLIAFSLTVLGVLLPWHGAITVFGPDWLRWWKEGVIFLLVLVLGWVELRRFVRGRLDYEENDELRITNVESNSKSEIRNPKQILNLNDRNGVSVFFALAFLGWLALLVLINPDRQTALVAARYLGFGFGVFVVGSRLLTHFAETERRQFWAAFTTPFVWSCAVAVLFGTWAKYGGGFEVLQNFYSQTISSWVPGQTIPLYHEAGGLVRMQGASSGPTAFAHLLLVGVAVLFMRDSQSPKPPFTRGLHWFFLVLFLFGIAQSLTRAVMLVAAGLVVWYVLTHWRGKGLKPLVGGVKTKLWAIAFLFVIGIGALFTNDSLRTNFVQRAGTSLHITRPIEAFQVGLQSPIVGNLGQLGPAARAKNLRENNDDRALIAENIFMDYWAQMGLLGLVLALGFFWALFRESSKRAWPFLIGTLAVVNIATIFDMSPVAITYFLLFAFFAQISTIPART